MKRLHLLFVVSLVLILVNDYKAQGISSILNSSGSKNFPTCGSYDLVETINKQNEGFLKLNDQLMEQLTQLIKSKKRQKSNAATYTIPIVFHIVHNNSQENLPDSVIFNQLKILNEAFRRQNADTINTRSDFKDIVGDAKIEFKLATTDPNGAATNGITRTTTNVKYFGGVLPYGQFQRQQIAQWVNDSLYYNYFRLTRSAEGGIDAWDTDRYLNVWIGDLRLFEPQINNFEELVFFALATPPTDHFNWPDSIVEQVKDFSQGVLMHYVAVGANNSNTFPPPYNIYNFPIKKGKVLVHEVGHYLGLRHIWGDGDCSVDDFIQDTPNNFVASAWDCNTFDNNCIDNINNVDLPNMVENYMDYSSGACQNSFTKGQIDLMRAALETYRPAAFDSTTSIANYNIAKTIGIDYYPNPSSGHLSIALNKLQKKVQVNIQNAIGQLVISKEFNNTDLIRLNFDLPAGIYFLNLIAETEQSRAVKLIVEAG